VHDYIKTRLAGGGLSRIDAIILSHLDADHISGLDALLGDPDVEKLIRRCFVNDVYLRLIARGLGSSRDQVAAAVAVPRSREALKSLLALSRLLTRRRRQGEREFHREVVVGSGSAAARQQLEIGGLPAELEVYALAPSQYLCDAGRRDLVGSGEEEAGKLARRLAGFYGGAGSNLGSYVLEICYGRARMLIGGDGGEEVWEDIFRRGLLGGYEVIVAPHHGGRLRVRGDKDLNAEFWARAGRVGGLPWSVVVSHGARKLAPLPHEDVVKEIVSRGGRIFCTGLKEYVRPDRRDRGGGEKRRWLELFGVGPVVVTAVNEGECFGDVAISLDVDGVKGVTYSGRGDGGNGSGCCRRTGEQVRAVYATAAEGPKTAR